MLESDWFLTAHIYSLILPLYLQNYLITRSLQSDRSNRTVKEPMEIK